jgi:hypothetical protein
MFRERFSDVCRVISSTAEFFNISCNIPEDVPGNWPGEDNARIVVRLGENHLVFYIHVASIGVELESRIGFTEKGKWQSKMEDLKLKDFSFSTFGVLFYSDTVFNLDVPSIETIEIRQKDTAGNLTEKSARAKPKKCPNCGHKVSENEISSGYCNDCEENFWVCPRCGDLIDKDPDDEGESCPSCKKIFATVKCKKCKKDIWIDESKCPECGENLKISKRLNCDKKLIVSEDLDECPYCQETIYICPRCNEYLDRDPDDMDSCPLCKKSLAEVDCPKCREEIFSDAERCGHCGKEFKLTNCPYDDCKKSLIPSDNITDCPHCQGDIKYVKCPDCSKEFYIEN